MPQANGNTPRHERRDAGESLIEILLTVVITGLTITALVSSLGTAGNAGNAQRGSVNVDIVMRNFAEATKAAAHDCVVGAALDIDFDPPSGYTVASEPSDPVCPDVMATQLVELAVTGLQGMSQTMDVKVRTP